MNILCVIPAKGYSERLHNKNLLNYKGKPLVAHAIEHAKGSKYPMRIVVATDSQEIANIASEWEVETAILPAFVSMLNVPDAVKWVYHNESYHHYIVTLQPTSPLRTSKDINQALYLADSSNAECVESRTRGKQNGAIYIYRGDTLYMFGHEENGQNLAQTEVYEMEEGLDIDTLEDWRELERRL